MCRLLLLRKEVVHEGYHKHRHASAIQEYGRTATDHGSHEAVRYHDL